MIFNILLAVLLMANILMGQLDSNLNGMSDVWEARYGAVGLDPNSDSDGDGQTALQESMAGTSPFSSTSALAVTSFDYYELVSVLEWQTVDGGVYQLQRNTLLDSEWVNIGLPIIGNGGVMTTLDTIPIQEQCFYRLQLSGNNKFGELPVSAIPLIDGHDLDSDGIDDLVEITNGLDPFDITSSLPYVKYSRGKGMQLTWLTVRGKQYQVQQADSPIGPWEDVGNTYTGTGLAFTSAVTFENDYNFIRVLVSDGDEDEDGLTDWEEYQLGLDPTMTHTDTLGSGDFLAATLLLASSDTLSIRAEGAVANITTMEKGGFKIVRTGGVAEVDVSYTVSGTAVAGSDYVALSGSATIPFGENSVVVPVIPIASSSMTLSESVVITLQDTVMYDLEAEYTQQINVLKEVAINVQTHGAVGDGVTDDTSSIQAAIDALESSSIHNTLYFPTGTYRLNTAIFDNRVIISQSRLLQIGTSDLSGRDIIIVGDENSVLYSTVSPVRSNMLVMSASFRSLKCRGLTWEKDSTPMSEVVFPGEPNGADGVSIVHYDVHREIESIEFDGCEFNNCHGAIFFYLRGRDILGKIKRFGIYNCNILNPYGSNSINSLGSWGGGQQVRVSPWVDEAIYTGNYFTGGSEDMTDSSTSPGGRLKDGSHFGSPLRLSFIDNVVKRMGVEAVIQFHETTIMGATDTPFTVPPADNTTIASVVVGGTPSTYEAGQLLNFRAWIQPDPSARNSMFTVIAFNPTTRLLSVVNPGHAGSYPAGFVIPSGTPMYLQIQEPTTGTITGNLIDGTVPPGGVAFVGSSGIAAYARVKITNNVILGYKTGILLNYEPRNPLHPPSRGSIIDSNIIVADNTVETNRYVSGVDSWADDAWIKGNYVISPNSYRVTGLVTRGSNTRIESNWILQRDVTRYGYHDSNRSVGIGIGNESVGAVIKGNHTYGHDVGVGPSTPFQEPPHSVIDHHSRNDGWAVDTHGLE